MKVLIVNNGLRYPSRIAKLFKGAEIEVVASVDVPLLYKVASHDCIVLSGSNQKPIPYFHQDMAPLLEWISQQTRPLIGICYGAELIAEAYGTRLHHLGVDRKIKGISVYHIPVDNELNLPMQLRLYEAHQWIIEKVELPLVPIITSEAGVALFRHQTLPQVGLMFHPEKFTEETDGTIVIESIFKHLGIIH